MSAGPLRALTVESLTEMLHDSKTDVTKQKLTEIDFSGENFQLETIENITIPANSPTARQIKISGQILIQNW